MKIQAQIKPNSKQASVTQPNQPDGVWIIATKAPAIDGRANQEAIKLLATELNLPKTAIRLKLGAKSKLKVFEGNR